jgi:magnesium transporter
MENRESQPTEPASPVDTVPVDTVPASTVPASTTLPSTAPAVLDAPEVSALIESGDQERLAEWFEGAESADATSVLARISRDDRERLLSMLDPDVAADVLETLPEPQALEAIEALEPTTAARILEELPSDEQADLIGELEAPEAEAILAELASDEAEDVRRLAAYDDDEAGGLMVTEFLVYSSETTVAGVLEDMSANADEYRHYDIQYAYVVDLEARLVGVLPMRDLLLAPRRATLSQTMIPGPVSLGEHQPLEEVTTVFRQYPFIGLPVVDGEQRLVGVLLRASLERALAEETEETYRQTQGIVGGEELRSMPLATRSRRRLSWLGVNIVLNLAAASVIAAHQDTLQAAISLAVFMPILPDMSGCSGNQAVAVSMRELALGVTRPVDVLRVLRKEFALGLVNGLALGLAVGALAALWKGNPYLGLVIGAALGLNTVLAVCLGGALPLLIKRLGQDPAVASGPLLTTMTDICGFTLVLSFASLVLERL